jgi:starch phosphorylase
MTSGCDVWLNTPKIGLEACGTSGMKAAVNGLLSLSTADGWMGEVDIDSIGWKLNDENISQSIYDTLEQKVIPAYEDYIRGADTYGWGNKMLASHKLITSRFSTTRMLDEYQKFMWLTSDVALK